MRTIKYVGASLLLVLAIIVLVFTSSIAESRFECAGTLSSKDGSLPETVYFKLDEYRWWVGLWSDSDGDLRLEVPNRSVEYYDRVTEVGDQLQIFDDQKLHGNFSTLSRALALNTPVGFFDGVCKTIDCSARP